MSLVRNARVVLTCSAVGLCLLSEAGCGRNAPPEASGARDQSVGKSAAERPGRGTTDDQASQPVRRKPAFGGPAELQPAHGSAQTVAASAGSADVIRKLKPLQVIVGEWQGIPRQQSVDTDQPAWRWDYSNPGQPALAFESRDGGYFKSGRLTWLPEENRFRLIAVLRDGTLKTYRGDADAQIRDVPAGDGKTTNRTFALSFTQVDPQPGNREELYRVAIQQVQNDRYLLIVSRKTGSRIAEVNRIGNQRSGTSFAAKLDDYGDKTCVISQGLGTMAVTHKGKTYYVCCSGCKKAFEAEPEKWIASFEKWKTENGKR